MATSSSDFAKCSCGQCGGHIEFGTSNAGEVVTCPHCGQQTRLPASAPAVASPVLAEEHVYFANNKSWRACPVTIHRGILEVADGRKVATRAITSKEIVSLPYSTKDTVARKLTTSQKVLRVVGWVLCAMLPLALVAVVQHSNASAQNQSQPTFSEVALLLTLAGPLLLFITRKRQTVQRTGTLHHLMITYPGCDQYIQTASSLMGAYGLNLGLGVVGTTGKFTSGDIVLSSTDRDAVAQLSEEIEKDLRDSPRV